MKSAETDQKKTKKYTSLFGYKVESKCCFVLKVKENIKFSIFCP